MRSFLFAGNFQRFRIEWFFDDFVIFGLVFLFLIKINLFKCVSGLWKYLFKRNMYVVSSIYIL